MDTFVIIVSVITLSMAVVTIWLVMEITQRLAADMQKKYDVHAIKIARELNEIDQHMGDLSRNCAKLDEEVQKLYRRIGAKRTSEKDTLSHLSKLAEKAENQPGGVNAKGDGDQKLRKSGTKS